jgi:hypothetical protein
MVREESDWVSDISATGSIRLRRQQTGDIEVLSDTLRGVRTFQAVGDYAQLRIRSEMFTITRQESPALCASQDCQPTFPV